MSSILVLTPPKTPATSADDPATKVPAAAAKVRPVVTGSRRSKLKRKAKEFPASLISGPGKVKRVRIKHNSSATGSVWDKTPRKKVDVKNLDLKRSYVESAKGEPNSQLALKPRQKRWKHDGTSPLINVEELPEDWNTREPDLDPK